MFNGSRSGSYVCRMQFNPPRAGVYPVREVWGFHGDLEPYPEREELTLPEYLSTYRKAMVANATLPEDLKIIERRSNH